MPRTRLGVDVLWVGAFGPRAESVILQVAHGAVVPPCTDKEASTFLQGLLAGSLFLRWLASSAIPSAYDLASKEKDPTSSPENTCFHHFWTTVEASVLQAWQSWVLGRETAHLSQHFDGILVDPKRVSLSRFLRESRRRPFGRLRVRGRTHPWNNTTWPERGRQQHRRSCCTHHRTASRCGSGGGHEGGGHEGRIVVLAVANVREERVRSLADGAHSTLRATSSRCRECTCTRRRSRQAALHRHTPPFRCGGVVLRWFLHKVKDEDDKSTVVTFKWESGGDTCQDAELLNLVAM